MSDLQARKVFLSYGRKDATEIAQRLRDDLRARGFDVWKDTESIPAGVDWQDRIIEALRGSGVVVALLTPHAVRRGGTGEKRVDDSACHNEIGFARWDVGVPIVPAMAERCEIPFALSNVHCLDFTGWRSDSYAIAFEALVDAIAAALRDEEPRRGWRASLEPRDDRPFLLEKRRGFEGREWLFEAMRLWLDEQQEQALLIVGEPGIGKTAILAELVHRKDERLLGYHCCRADLPASLTPSELIRNLAGRLVSRLPEYAALVERRRLPEGALSHAACAEDPAAAFEAGILSPLATIAAPGVTRYLFIDALDESLADRAGGYGIVHVLAPRLALFPPWLKLMATTRPDRHVLRQLAGLRATHIHARGDANRRDLSAYLDRRLADPALAARATEQDVRRTDAARLLMRVADGNFLVAQEALRDVELGVCSFAELGGLPSGLNGIYERFFTRQFPSPEAYQGPRRILECLAVGREPLGRGEIGVVAELGDDESRLHLASLASYLRQEDGRILPWHKSLIDWLVDPDCPYAVNRPEAHESFGRACAQAMTGRGPLAGYALRHVATHLRLAEKWSELMGVLTDLAYLERKVDGMVFELVDELRAGLAAIPPDHAGVDELEIIAHAVQQASHFLDRHPELFMPCMWNGASWFASAQGRKYFGEAPECPPEKLFAPLAVWRARPARLPWLRAVRPLDDGGGGPLEAVLHQPESAANCLAVSRDGCLVASGHGSVHGSEACDIRLWDVATGRELAVLRGHSSRVNSVDFDPSGARLVSGSGSYTSSENSVRLWDVDSGAELRRIDFPGNVQAVAFSPDGAHIACGVRGAPLILDAELQTEARSIGRHERITCLAWAPDGGYLVSGGWDKVVRLWDPKSGEVLRVLEGHEKPISSVAVSPDSSRIVSGGYAYSESDDRTVRIWDAATGKEVACGQGLSDVVMGVAVSPDGKQVCAGLNGELRVFSLSSGAELRRIPFDSSTLTPVAYLNDGRVVSAGGYEDNKMRLWNLSRRDRYRLSSHANPIADVRFSPHGARLLTLGYDGIGVWDVSDGRPTDWHSIEQYVKRLAVSPDEARIVVVGHRCLVLDAATGETCLDLGTMDGMLGDFVSYCGNGSRILARIFQDGALLWDARSGKRLGHWPGARWVTCRPADDKAFVLISQFPTHQHSELVVVDLKRGRELRREVLEESADHLASHPRDTLVATLGNGRLVVRDYAAGRVEWSAPFEKAAERIEFSSDGGVLIVAHRSDAEDVVSVWETATGRELERLDGRGDLDALAQDYGRPSIRLMSRGTELVAETNDGRALGRMPMSNVKRIVTAPSGLTWAIQTRGGRCPQLVTLEGLPPHLADLQRIFRVP